MRNIEQNLSLIKKKPKRNETNQIIIEVFGSWNVFRRLIKEGLQNIDYNPLENKANKNILPKAFLEITKSHTVISLKFMI